MPPLTEKRVLTREEFIVICGVSWEIREMNKNLEKLGGFPFEYFWKEVSSDFVREFCAIWMAHKQDYAEKIEKELEEYKKELKSQGIDPDAKDFWKSDIQLKKQKPIPPGFWQKEWDLAYNSADSEIRKKSGLLSGTKELKEFMAEQRENGAIRAKAKGLFLKYYKVDVALK